MIQWILHNLELTLTRLFDNFNSPLKPVQSKNAPSPISVTESGMMRDPENPEHSEKE